MLDGFLRCVPASVHGLVSLRADALSVHRCDSKDQVQIRPGPLLVMPACIVDMSHLGSSVQSCIDPADVSPSPRSGYGVQSFLVHL